MNTGRALYLDAATQWQVKLADGVALQVSAPNRARSLYPIDRLARVVSPALTDWSLSALLACVQAGVPVVFHDSHGDPIGWCFGARRRETTLTTLLREGLHHPEWTNRFGTWYEAAERNQIIHALDATGTSCRWLDAPGARVLLCNRHRQRIGAPVGTVLRALRCAATALTSELLQRHVDDPTLIGFARPGLHLGQLMTGLLEWPTHRILWTALPDTIVKLPPAKFAAMAIERRGAILHRTMGDLLGSLELNLREWLG